MNRTEIKGLVFGFFFGLFLLWWNWPEGVQFTDAQVARAAGQVLGTMALCWFIARLIRNGERGPRPD
jgi:hypothetical protein